MKMSRVRVLHIVGTRLLLFPQTNVVHATDKGNILTSVFHGYHTLGPDEIS